MTSKLYLQITSDAGKDSSYIVERVYPDDDRIRLMWILKKEDADETYTIILNQDKVVKCDCPHSKYSKLECKHVDALRARGLLPGGGA